MRGERAQKARRVGAELDRQGLAPTWRLAPEPFALSPEVHGFLVSLGGHLHRFLQAANRLYLRAARGSLPDWVREYLEMGKTETVLDYGRMRRFRTDLPLIIRPDVFVTDSGFRVSEIDSVPGGMGVLAAMSEAYAADGHELIGGEAGFVEALSAAFAGLAPDVSDPLVAIAVSDESEDYRKEMKWLAEALRRRGRRAYACHPKDLIFNEDGLHLETESGVERVHILYRFFELFDLKNIPKIDLILYAIRKETVAVTPPLKHHLEEKSLFALFHHPLLQGFWKQELGEETYGVLRDVIPPTWILDPRPLPPHAVIPGLRIGGEPVADWSRLKEATQRERELVIKPSGFSPLAWGSRGVSIGHDMSAEDWGAAVDEALAGFHRTPSILQPFHKAVRSRVSYVEDAADQNGELLAMDCRARLCPYYVASGGEVKLTGVLATLCPADKKIIHGMNDAVMAPCRLDGPAASSGG